jgi:hypothetical protein
VSITAPSPVQPAAGSISFGWPTFAVANAVKANTTNPLEYRFEISTHEDFSLIALAEGVPEASGQTAYTPPAGLAAPAEGTLYWRVVVHDRGNGVQSPPTAAQSFRYFEDTPQSRMAVDIYGGLWPNARPAGVPGRSRLGPGWAVGQVLSFDGVLFQSPPLEVLRVYDLIDHGLDPDSAISWMHANGYPTVAVWYPSVACIGFPFQYMALIGGEWELVRRVGA